jgi:hypothetical protein
VARISVVLPHTGRADDGLDRPAEGDHLAQHPALLRGQRKASARLHHLGGQLGLRRGDPGDVLVRRARWPRRRPG